MLGIYIPLVAMNCLVLVSAEEFAMRNNVVTSFLHTLKTGMIVFVILIVAGMMREITGSGTFLNDAELLFGDVASSWQLTLLDDESGLSLFTSATGAFLVLGLILAFLNLMTDRIRRLAT